MTNIHVVWVPANFTNWELFSSKPFMGDFYTFCFATFNKPFSPALSERWETVNVKNCDKKKSVGEQNRSLTSWSCCYAWRRIRYRCRLGSLKAEIHPYKQGKEKRKFPCCCCMTMTSLQAMFLHNVLACHWKALLGWHHWKVYIFDDA